MSETATDGANTPTQGLTLDEAFAQLQASRNQASEDGDNQDGENVEVDEDELEEEEEELEADELDNESDESEEESEEENVGEEDETPDVWELEIDGETVEVSTEELHKGYLRHNDYTRKRQADAKKAKELEATYQTKLTQLDQALAQSISAEEVEIGQLQKQYASTDDADTRRGIEYRVLKLQQQVGQRRQALSAAQQLQQEAAQAQQEAYWAEQEELLTAKYEDWGTKKVELKDYLTGLGFEDLSPFARAEMAEIVDKAKQFDELQQKRKKVVSKKIRRKVPQVVKAGKGEKKFNLDSAAIAEAQAKFDRTGNLKDALALQRLKRGN